MTRTFGQFKKSQLPRHGDLTSAERALVHAFNKGAEAGRSDELRRPPYMPTTEREKFEAWLCGYDGEQPRYAIAAGSGTAKTPKAVECEASQSGPL